MNSFLFEKLLFSYVTLKFLFSQRFAFCHFWTIIENYLLDHKIKFQLRIENQDRSRNKTRGQKIEWFNPIQLQHCWCFSCCLHWTLGPSSKCSQLKSFTQKSSFQCKSQTCKLEDRINEIFIVGITYKNKQVSLPRYCWSNCWFKQCVYSEKDLSGMSKMYSMEYFYK